jgi:hypothetical protein
MASNGNSKSGLLTAGGILSLVAGILQINTGVGLIGCCLWGSFVEDFPLSIIFLPGFWPILNQHIFRLLGFGYVPTGWVITGAFFVILGIVAVVGGISAIRRKRFGLSLAGAICALLSGLMGILAVIFVALGKREFRKESLSSI